MRSSPPPIDPASLLRAVLAGDRAALRAFVGALSPIIQARVVRGLLRRRSQATGRDPRQEVEDMTQDVFAALFAHDGRVLRSWDASRGLSLANFVGLVAERHVAATLRSGRKSPWRDVPEELDALEASVAEVPDALPRLESRRELERLLDRMREALSVRGLELFQRLYVEQEPIDEVASAMHMSREAVYAWRSRVTKLLRTIAADAERSADGAVSASDPAPRAQTPEGGASHADE